MRRMFKSRSVKGGLPPGALVHVGERKVDEPKIKVIEYDETRFVEREPGTVEECLLSKDYGGVTWINLDGLHDTEMVGKLWACYGLHSLVVEDVVNTSQRPKLDDHGEYIFVVLKSLYYADEDSGEPEIEQISLVIGPDYVLSFQEREGDEFDPIRDRIRGSVGRVRKVGADYLAYALIDLVVDEY